MYYLQSRYYDPSIGRFINADEYVSTGLGLLGFNMFAYTDNNPVNRIDVDGRRWTHFQGVNTTRAVQTHNISQSRRWARSQGIIPAQRGASWVPTSAQRAVGVRTTTVNGQRYLDFTVPINDALDNVIQQALPFGENSRGRMRWFISQVNHRAPWDIKRPGPWNATIGEDTYPGWGVVVRFRGKGMTPEQLGNFTYGYIGRAAGYGLFTLMGASFIVAFPLNRDELFDEFGDWVDIRRGYIAFGRR